MGKAEHFDVIYTDGTESKKVFISFGDSVRSDDWVKENFPFPPYPKFDDGMTDDERDAVRNDYLDAKANIIAKREYMSGMYGVFLAAKRAGIPHTDGDVMDFLDVVAVPSVTGEAVESGETNGPSSEV